MINLFISFISSVEKIGQNKILIGLSTIFGILGGIISIYLLFKTKKISKILQLNKTVIDYNESRVGYQRTFEGHRRTIDSGDERSNSLFKDILGDVEAYKSKFNQVIHWRERWNLFLLVNELKKNAEEVDCNKVSNHLAQIYGRLEKEEDKF